MSPTLGIGFLARAGVHYSDAEDDAISKEVAACPGCVSSDQILDAYAESIRNMMQDIIFNAVIGIAFFRRARAFP